MGPAASVTAIPGNPARELDDAYRPAGVFISYVSEDYDIALAIYESLQALGETIYDRIKTFLAPKSIQGGDEIRTDIKANLEKSDFLVVLYTGRFKHSFSYTGWEVGFFEGLIAADITKSGKTTRKIIYLYSDEMPSIGSGILGISIEINKVDLGGSRADYVQKSIQTPDDPDTLARALDDIAKRAESRLPPPLSDGHDELAKKRAIRLTRIAEDIIPNLKGKLFDSMSMLVLRRSIEQRLIEFELPKSASDQIYANIPDNAKLTPHSRALEIFGISNQDDPLTWSEFSNQVRSFDSLGGSSILLAIEQAVISAISSSIQLDNDQILKSSNEQVFRVLVTRQLEYFNRRRVVQVYFIQKLEASELGNNDTSTILGFINVAAKYRFIFIEQNSPLSVESFTFEPDHAKIQNKVRQLIRELILIEEEAHNFELDQIASISKYFGGDPEHLATAKLLQDKWIVARRQLMASAEKILGLGPTSAEFAAANKEWLETLGSFRQTSEEINSTVAVQALENLKKSFMTSGAAGSAGQV